MCPHIKYRCILKACVRQVLCIGMKGVFFFLLVLFFFLNYAGTLRGFDQIYKAGSGKIDRSISFSYSLSLCPSLSLAPLFLSLSLFLVHSLWFITCRSRFSDFSTEFEDVNKKLNISEKSLSHSCICLQKALPPDRLGNAYMTLTENTILVISLNK